MATAIETYLSSSVAVLQRMLDDADLLAKVREAADRCIEAIRGDRKVMFAGNGGSAADAQHLAGELVSRFNYDRPGMAGFALTTDMSILTAVSNDYGYEMSFARQIEALARPGDVLIGLSTSGRSPNVLRALEAARARGVTVIGFTGRDGGEMTALCDIEIRIPDQSTPLIQQGHMVVGHLICALLEEAVHPRAEI
ncbi:D-sedoheptulose 7-phosphate isomerase [Rhodoblastus sp.]|uniref:D-sedoheptulose-7-phosphate isomerase n=1 Tax=Rhodoblastus sp. TaxID=1962975 RepID=UPI00261AE9D4|nr:D-sedoheptulose 7-phosphate isomerase [Rhodoblastus sp.]